MGGSGGRWGGALAGALLVVGCGAPDSETATTTPAPPEASTGADLCDAFQQVDDGLARLERLWPHDVETGGAPADAGSSSVPPGPDELRTTGDALEELGRALRDLGSHLDADASDVLAAIATTHLELAARYEELGHDLADLEDLDEETLARLVDLSLAIGLGPAENAQQVAALDELLATADARCPDRLLEHVRRAATDPEDPGPADPEPAAALIGHTVRLSDEARSRLDGATESTIAFFDRPDGDSDPDHQAPEEPCPLWDSAAVDEVADGLLDVELQSSSIIQGRAMEGDDPATGWRFSCGSRVPGDPETTSEIGLEIQAMPIAALRARPESSDPRETDGHPIWERTTTSFDRRVHEGFAADDEADLAILVRASEPELVRAVLALVLDDLV